MPEVTNGIERLHFKVLRGEQAKTIDPEGVLWPPDSLVTFAERGNKIVGRCALIELPHIEGTWVAKEEQKSTIAFRMVNGAEKTLKHLGAKHVIAFVEANNAEVQGYVERMGYKKQRLEVWVKEL
jgi:RimJ/RimL family protein N-acetyltransferase